MEVIMESDKNLNYEELKTLVKRLFTAVRKMEGNTGQLSLQDHKQLDITENLLFSFFTNLERNEELNNAQIDESKYTDCVNCGFDECKEKISRPRW